MNGNSIGLLAFKKTCVENHAIVIFVSIDGVPNETSETCVNLRNRVIFGFTFEHYTEAYIEFIVKVEQTTRRKLGSIGAQ